MSHTTAAAVPFFSLRLQFDELRAEVSAAVSRVLESQQFILGEEVEKFEQELAAYCGCSHAVGCASGSDALILALRALDLPCGAQVLTTPFSFFATAGAISHAGATPVFADIDPATFNLDPAAAAAALDSHPGIAAILPVHLYGDCASMDRLLDLASRRGIPLIEDAAQAIGAEYRGRRAGSLGKIGCFSFFPTKNLGAFGDGGILTTNDPETAQRLRALRVHGSSRRYYHDEIGYNSRLDTLQAAVLRVKLRHLDRWTQARQRHALYYTRRLADLGAPVQLPAPSPPSTRHIYHQYVIRAPRRDQLRAHLSSAAIGTEVYYPLPLHRQECFQHLGYRAGDFPVSEQCAAEVLALPIYPELTEEDLEAVCREIARFYRSND